MQSHGPYLVLLLAALSTGACAAEVEEPILVPAIGKVGVFASGAVEAGVPGLLHPTIAQEKAELTLSSLALSAEPGTAFAWRNPSNNQVLVVLSLAGSHDPSCKAVGWVAWHASTLPSAADLSNAVAEARRLNVPLAQTFDFNPDHKASSSTPEVCKVSDGSAAVYGVLTSWADLVFNGSFVPVEPDAAFLSQVTTLQFQAFGPVPAPPRAASAPAADQTQPAALASTTPDDLPDELLLKIAADLVGKT